MKKGTSCTQAIGEPCLHFLVFVGVVLGMVLMQQRVRLTALWVVLLVLRMLFRGVQEVSFAFLGSSL